MSSLQGLRLVDDARRDLDYAGRMLVRHPLFSLIAALSLAIGIGSTTAVFSIASALLLRPAPGLMDPARLVDIGTSRMPGRFGPSSYPNYLDLRTRVTTLDGVYAYSRFPEPMALGGDEPETERVFASLVTANYFTAVGAVPFVGRLLSPADGDQPGASPFVVLSHRLWTRRFNGDRAIAGKPVTLNGQPFTVIGVAAPGFRGTGVRAVDVWVPVAMTRAVLPQRATSLSNRAVDSVLVGGRLKAGVSVSQAAAELDAIGLAMAGAEPLSNRGLTFRVMAMSPVPGKAGPVVALVASLFVIVSLVLIVACTNVAGMLLARAATRRREMAVRLAIGAGRMRLMRQVLTEGLVLFALGGTAGVLLTLALTRSVMALLPALPFPVDLALPLDVRILGFSGGLSLGAALLCGLAPALHASKPDLASALKKDSERLGRLRLRHVFVVGQVGFSILLIVGAALFMRALQRAATIDPGFDAHGVELAPIDLAQAGYSDTAGPALVRDLIDRVRQLHGVQAATAAASVPGGFEVRREELEVPGVASEGQLFDVDWNIIAPAYFTALRTALVAGRDFAAADRAGAQGVAIVSETAARQFWKGGNPLGKTLVQRRLHSTLQVVGVVRDVQSTSLVDGVNRATVYVPLAQQYVPNVTIIARSTQGQRIAGPLGALLRSTNPTLAIVPPQTLDDSVALGLMPQRIAAAVSGTLGIVAVFLAGLGIYGVTAYSVARRTREIGIRVAIGASRAAVVAMVLREALWLAATGSAIGLALAAGVSQVIATFLFGIAPIDPVAFGGTILLFAVISLAACYGPVRRATHIDPVQSLRYD